jgi:anaerobic carbon-monoxide dehydrogenase iron sulfur subunit
MMLILDEKKCNGCKICELACSSTHQGVFNPVKAHLKIVVVGKKIVRKKQLRACTLCLSCVNSCPVEAISFNGKWLVVDNELCSGCGQCVDVCPEGVICLGNDGKAAVPDFCHGNPSCIDWCPHQALSRKEDAV